jgi:hypothetical protein
MPREVEGSMTVVNFRKNKLRAEARVFKIPFLGVLKARR